MLAAWCLDIQAEGSLVLSFLVGDNHGVLPGVTRAALQDVEADLGAGGRDPVLHRLLLHLLPVLHPADTAGRAVQLRLEGGGRCSLD